jgi:hypothetical protein
MAAVTQYLATPATTSYSAAAEVLQIPLLDHLVFTELIIDAGQYAKRRQADNGAAGRVS